MERKRETEEKMKAKINKQTKLPKKNFFKNESFAFSLFGFSLVFIYFSKFELFRKIS